MRVAVSSGSLVVYGATTDNITQDPALQFAKRVSSQGTEGESRVIPVIGSVAGSLGSYFKTEAQLHNPLGRTLSGRIDFRPQGSGAVAASLTFELLPSRSLYVADLLPEMGVASGIGTAEIVSTSPGGGLPVAVIRIFNDAGEQGTTGMTEDPIVPDNALQPGETGVLIAPPDPARARFNIGVRALGGGASLLVTVRDADGVTKATLAKAYGPNAFEQTSSVSFLGLTLAASDTIAITVNSGSAIVYGATTDNTTQDPSLQFAQRH